MQRLIASIFIITICVVFVKCYEVPPAVVQPLSPVGLRVSIPDHPGVTLFAFHGKINQDFELGREAGEEGLNSDVLRKKNGMWVFINRTKKLKPNDVIYYWLYVIKDGLGYERLFQSYTVTEFFSESDQPGAGTGTGTGTGTVTPVPPPPPPPPVVPVTPKPCEPSQTLVNNQPKCKREVLLDVRFSNGLSNQFKHIVQISDPYDEPFVVFNDNSENTYIADGNLVIKPTLIEDSQQISSGTIDLGGKCTNSILSNCKRTALGSRYLPPVTSARLTSKSAFSFCYGVVEIRAKLPQGDWVAPELWLEPVKEGFSPKKMIVASAFGNKDLTSWGTQIGNRHLFAGLQVDDKVKDFTIDKLDGMWSDDFHTYKMIWNPDFIGFYVDNNPIGQWKSSNSPPFIAGSNSKIAPFNEEYYLVLGVQVGGVSVFPDDAVSNNHRKPWNNTGASAIRNFYSDRYSWHSTWNSKTQLQIEYIKVTAL